MNNGKLGRKEGNQARKSTQEAAVQGILVHFYQQHTTAIPNTNTRSKAEVFHGY